MKLGDRLTLHHQQVGVPRPQQTDDRQEAAAVGFQPLDLRTQRLRQALVLEENVRKVGEKRDVPLARRRHAAEPHLDRNRLLHHDTLTASGP
jgi:hypothetical protein